MSAAVSPETRRKVLRVISISLLLDLMSFTFILPLFPKLLEFYLASEASSTSADGRATLLQTVFSYLNRYKEAFERKIDSRYDIVLLGGALGSLFSILQAIASPLIGFFSDRYGRRNALLASMMGNILSVALWLAAARFPTFVLSRIVGGLSEGNVQLATAMATDISDEKSRGSTMALIGACFSIAFTFGPMLGAWLSSIAILASNPFATAAGVSLLLIVVETVYLYAYLPETHPALVKRAAQSPSNGHADGKAKDGAAEKPTEDTAAAKPQQRTNSHALLYSIHFFFLLFFSGMESSLSFMTYELFGFESAKNGRLLGFVGLVASILQGGVTRRLAPLVSVRTGIISCFIAFVLLARISTVGGLYLAASFLALTSATVVTGLNALSSFEASEGERGGKLGWMRSSGQLGRGLGPILFTSVYWWAGREAAYAMGANGIALVATAAIVGLKTPGSVRPQAVVG